MTATNTTLVDRLDGVNEGLAYKAPCRAATTANIALSGEQTLDGVACVDGDLALVKNQTDATTNGIYVVSTGVWVRATNANGNRDLVRGSRVSINEGSTLGGSAWRLTTADPVTIDDDDLTWELVPGSGSVLSVALTMPAEFSVAGSPVTTTGTLAVTKANEVQNTVWAGPTSGADAQPTFRALVAADVPTNPRTATLKYVIDGGGSTISTGIKLYEVAADFNCTIQQVTLIADQSGSIVVDIYKCAYTQFDAGSTHPVVGDKITASAPPTISSATKSKDSTLTGWTTSITAGDVWAFKVNSSSTITRLAIAIKVLKT